MFGCSAYIHVPKDERKKLDPKAKKCTFLGYGTSRKGYRLYDWKTSCIIHSRDVELSRGYEGAKEKRLVQVENFTEAPEPEEDSDEVESDDNSGEPEREEDPRELERDDREPEEEDASAPRRTSTRKPQRPDYYGGHVYAVTDH